MSRIDEMIAELAPDGVPHARIGDIAVVGTGSSDRKDATLEGEYPFYVRSRDVLRTSAYEFDEDAIVIPGEGGIGEIFHFVRGRYALHQRAYRIAFHTNEVDTKYAFYAFSAHFKRFILQKAVSGTVVSIRKPMITDFKIPVPTLEVQREVVRILDQFTELEAELEAELKAELEARRQQYDFYRDQLLTFPTDVLQVALGDLGSIFGGLTGKSKADFSNGNARFASYRNVFSNISLDTKAVDFVHVAAGERQRSLEWGDIVFTGSSESLAEVGMASAVTEHLNEPLYLNSFCIGFRPNDVQQLNPEFAKHLFRSTSMREQIKKTASGVTRINISKARLAKILVPVPEPGEQLRIAGMLDRLYALVNDLSVSLPAELSARRMQYEYYRDKLLTFEEAPA